MYEHEAEEMTETLQKHIGSVVTFNKFCFINKSGGTGISDWEYDQKYTGPNVEAKITKIWYDYECGIKMHARPLPNQPTLEAYLDRVAFKGDYKDNELRDLVPGEHYKLYVSEFDLVE